MPRRLILPRIFHRTDIVRKQYVLSCWQLNICTLYCRFLLCDIRNARHMPPRLILSHISNCTDVVCEWNVFYRDRC